MPAGQCRCFRLELSRCLSLLIGLLTFLPASLTGAGRLIINEVMINEPGSETSLEWVELFNAGSDSLDLQGYIFIEAADTARFTKRWLDAREFVVLARKPFSTDGSASFERQWGNGSNVWGDDSLESYNLLAAKMSLRNSNDSVTIVELSTGKVETVKWASSPADGVSLERVNPGTEATAKNFKQCKAASQSTPGRVNSVVAKMRDWGWNEDDCDIFVPPNADTPLEIRLSIRNCGQSMLEEHLGTVIHDLNFNSKFDAVDSTSEFKMDRLLPDSERVVTLLLHEDSGRRSYIIRLPSDDDSTNNEIRFECVIGSHAPEIVISEIMNTGTDSLGCEWIEAQSIVAYRVSLNGWSVEVDGRATLLDSLGNVEAGERIVLCEDSVCFRARHPVASCQLIQPGAWRALGNTIGSIVLRMHLGALSDSVEFRGVTTPGQSWERDFDSTGVAFESRFYRSTAVGGSTPCADNSDRPVPVAIDVGFSPGSLKLTIDGENESIITASFQLVNYGYRPSGLVTVHVFDDTDHDGVASPDEWIHDYEVESIAGGDSSKVVRSFSAGRGRHRLIFELDDEVMHNNIANCEITLGPATKEVVVTEFLADPTGELESEWVEIRNVSGFPVDLRGWKFGDLTHQNLLDNAPVLEPGDYCVIAQDRAAFIRFYDAGCSPFECKSWSSLNNAGDCVVLRDEFGTVSDSVYYSGGVGENRSLELNEAAVPGLPGWNQSRSPTGSTPCRTNSPLPIPAAFDAGFVAGALTISKDSTEAELVNIRAQVANCGYQRLGPFAIEVFDDRDHDSETDEDELITVVEADPIEARDTLVVEFAMSLPSGRHTLILRLSEDEVADNNTCRAEISTGTLLREVIITEFVADPTGELESEWIEIRNVVSYPIDLNGWVVGDLQHQSQIEEGMILNQGEYCVIAQDKGGFIAHYKSGCVPLECSSWSSLNNGGDCIVLRDEFGTVSDSVSYLEVAGENRSLEFNESESAGWYPSTATTGATPCAANSVSGHFDGQTTFALLHRVFAPEAGEELHFIIQCAPASRFTIEVYDLAGRRQRVIANEEYFSSGEFVYDGVSDFHSHLQIGAYILKIESADGTFSQKAGFAVAPPK